MKFDHKAYMDEITVELEKRIEAITESSSERTSRPVKDRQEVVGGV